jgi:hypothetical protein
MAAVVAVVLHTYEVPPEAVRVAFCPAQVIPSLLVVPLVSVTLIEGVGSAFTVTVKVAVAEQLFAFVTVTV